jgi:hypothetical protein
VSVEKILCCSSCKKYCGEGEDDCGEECPVCEPSEIAPSGLLGMNGHHAKRKVPILGFDIALGFSTSRNSGFLGPIFSFKLSNVSRSKVNL